MCKKRTKNVKKCAKMCENEQEMYEKGTKNMREMSEKVPKQLTLVKD